MKFGLIGLGGYGQFLLDVINETPNATISALSTRNPDKATEILKKFDIKNCYSNWHDLVKDKEIEAVIIATPPYLHFEMAKKALTSGKHVLIEKPIALNVIDAKKLIKIAENKKLRLVVDHELRYNFILNNIKKAFETDLLGNLTNITFTNFASDENLPRDHWFWDKKKSGGIFIEHACHFFDVYSYLFGDSDVKFSTRQIRTDGAEDKVFAVTRYKNGAEASFLHSFDRPYALEQTVTRLTFKRANFVIEGWIPIKFIAQAIVSDTELKNLKEIFPMAYFSLPKDRTNYHGGGQDYPDHHFVEFKLDLGDKQENYKKLVKELLNDFIKSIQDKNFKPLTEAKNVLPGLSLACSSSKKAKLL